MDFANADASRAVTAALLAQDYGVAWSLAAGQLIPPVPGRANYIAWLADLLTLSSPPGAIHLQWPILHSCKLRMRFNSAHLPVSRMQFVQ